MNKTKIIIDTELKAWLLGLKINSYLDTFGTCNLVSIAKIDDLTYALEELKGIEEPNDFSEDVCEFKNGHERDFIRGLVEGVCLISTLGPHIVLGVTNRNILNIFSRVIRSKHVECTDEETGKSVLSWTGDSALDFMGELLEGATFYTETFHKQYMELCGERGALIFARTDERAVVPSKSRVSDSGYDLTLISEVKRVGDVIFYDTGVQVMPPYGYYFDLVPRSSISKTGYMLANSVGVIDRTYRGNIMVPLRKVDKNAADLTLPCKAVQIIPRRIVHLQTIEVESLEETSRGDGGFGSTGAI